MRVRVLTITALFAVVMAFGAASASAQGLAQQGRFNVPFDFTVDGKVLPAGEYTVIGESEFIRVRSKNGKHASITLTSRRTGASRKANEIALAFRVSGDHYQLSQVWLPDGIGRELRNKRKANSTVASNERILEIVVASR